MPGTRYDDPERDDLIRKALAKAFARRKIIKFRIDNIVNGGSLHCFATDAEGQIVIYADLQNKTHVPEDVFSSTCLGLLHLLPDNDLLSFISRARTWRGRSLCLVGKNVRLEFWPYLPGDGFPDALLTILTDNSIFKVIIEAKIEAPQSGNQLSNYLSAMYRAFPLNSAVVYLTHHRSLPKMECAESERAVGQSAEIFWLSWYELFTWLQDQFASESQRPLSERRILRLLSTYLVEKGFRKFLGWNQLSAGCVPVLYHRNYLPALIELMSAPYERRYTNTYAGEAVFGCAYSRRYKMQSVTSVHPLYSSHREA